MQHSPITLVTAYFELEDPSRGWTVHTYSAWMANLLPFIRWPLVIFCDEQSVDTIKRLRGQKPAVYCVTSPEEFFVYRYRDIIHAHIVQRRRKLSPDVALIYHEKANFVRRAIDMNVFGSEIFFWCDIGFFRSLKRYEKFRLSDRIEWPNLQACRTLFGDKVAFFGVTKDSDARLYPPWMWGGFWAGMDKPMRRFCDAYYDFLDYCVSLYSSAILRGVAVPKGRGFFTDELIFRHLYSGTFRDPGTGARIQFADMHIFTEDNLHWVRRLQRLKELTHPPPPPPPLMLSYRDLAILYCLNAGRFPGRYLGREISLLACARSVAEEAVRSIRRRVRNRNNQ